MANYKGYQDKRGNTIEFIDGKWQMYDDGGYYVLDESSIPAELLTPYAKAKASEDFLSYVSGHNQSTKEARERIKTIEESLKRKAPLRKDVLNIETQIMLEEGLTIKSQVKGWADWSTATLPPKVREAAEWLIANGYENQKDVQSVFYNRQTSSTSDDFRAEEKDNNAIIKLAEAYKIKKSKEPAEPTTFSKAMRTMLQSQKDNGANEGYDSIGKTSVKDFDRALDDNRKLQSELRSVKDKALKILGFIDNTKSVKKGGEKKMSTEKASDGKRYTPKEKREYFGKLYRGEAPANPNSKFTPEQQKFIALGRKIELDRSARITARKNSTPEKRAEYDLKNAQYQLNKAKSGK